MGRKLKAPRGAAANHNKAKERETRRALNKAKGRAKFNSSEERQYAQQLEQYGARINVMASDGNCLFRSIADQYEGRNHQHAEYRDKIIAYIEEHRDDFEPFLEDDEKWDDYISRMRNVREWGGQQELAAAAKLLHVNIVIHQFQAPRYEILMEGAQKTLHLSYHGEAHYNSVRALDDPFREGEEPKPLTLGTSSSSSSSSSSSAIKKKNGGNFEKEKAGQQEENGKAEEETEKPARRKSSGGSSNGKSKKKAVANEDEKGEENEEQQQQEEGNEGDVEDEEGKENGHEEEDEEGADEDGEREEKKGSKKVGGQCPCGSGKKWRKCCRKAERQKEKATIVAASRANPSSSTTTYHHHLNGNCNSAEQMEDKLKAIVL